MQPQRSGDLCRKAAVCVVETGLHQSFRSMTRPCGCSAGLATLDLTARGPCILGRAVACGAGASSTPLSALPARLVGLSGQAADRLVLSTPSGGAAETAGGIWISPGGSKQPLSKIRLHGPCRASSRREAPGRQEKTIWTAWEAPGRQDRNNWPACEAPGRHHSLEALGPTFGVLP